MPTSLFTKELFKVVTISSAVGYAMPWAVRYIHFGILEKLVWRYGVKRLFQEIMLQSDDLGKFKYNNL